MDIADRACRKCGDRVGLLIFEALLKDFGGAKVDPLYCAGGGEHDFSEPAEEERTDG